MAELKTEGEGVSRHCLRMNGFLRSVGKEGRLTGKRLVSVAPVRVFGQKVGVEISIPDVVVRERREGVQKAVLGSYECQAGMFRVLPMGSKRWKPRER